MYRGSTYGQVNPVRKNFKLDLCPYGDYAIRPTTWEHFGSLSELEAGLNRMKPYRYGDGLNKIINRPGFCGYSSPEELVSLLKGGIKDTSALRKFHNFKIALNKNAHVRKRQLDIVGEEVDVPTFITGMPECMICDVKMPIPKKALRLIIDGSILAELTVQELEEAGLVISKIVMFLEKQGRPVILSTFHAAVTYPDLLVTSIDIRRPGSQLNPRKLLFCTHPSLHRGAVFAWRMRLTQKGNVGTSLYTHVEDHSKFLQMLKDHFFREKELYLIRISDVVSIIRDVKHLPNREKIVFEEVFKRYLS